MPRHLSRRRFLEATAAGLLTARLSAADKQTTANERLHVGVIGVRGQGTHDMMGVADGGAAIVALCDVDDSVLGEAQKKFPQAKTYTDFRRLLAQKDLDAVVVGTPDHWHAPITLRALQAGLHVLCEKPLTHTVAEARLVAETAAKHKRVTQMGTQIHAGGNYRRVVELIQSGAVGPVREVQVWCDTVWSGGDRPKETPAVPKGVHYDMWVGPAPYRPYHPVHFHYVWRGWWDFGGGTLADMACHYMDLPFWALKLRHPDKVAAEGSSPVHPDSAARWLKVHYEFPAREGLPPVKLTWQDGGKRPAVQEEKHLPNWGAGVYFIGEKGVLAANYDQHKLCPEKDFADFTPPKPSIPDSVGHYREWVAACKSGGPTTCPFHSSGALTEAVLLGNVSYRLGRPLTWDAKNLRAVNEPEADRYLHKEYRKPWTLT